MQAPTSPVTLDAPWPHFGEDEVQAATEVLRSGRVNYWTGEVGRQFEREFASWIGAGHAIAMSNGTVTIEAGLKVLGMQPGDEVLVASRSFMASASTVAFWGGRPVFADVDRESGNVSVETLEAVWTPKTKGVIPVHLGGWPCDMPKIMEWARSKGLFVIEDCAQSLGAQIDGVQTGRFGDFNSFSFCQDKIITSGGEGGMVTTDRADLWDAAWSLKDHGKSFDTVYHKPHGPGFRWLHESYGTNWRMTEVQSAIGRCQLSKLSGWLQKRKEYAAVYDEALAGIATVRTVHVPAGWEHAYYKYYCYVVPEALKADWSRDRVLAELTDLGMKAYSGSCSEMYLEKAFQKAGHAPAERHPVARELGETSLMFLVHPTFERAAIERMATMAADVLKRAQK